MSEAVAASVDSSDLQADRLEVFAQRGQNPLFRFAAFLVDAGVASAAGLVAAAAVVALSTSIPFGFRHVLGAYLIFGAAAQLIYEALMESRGGATLGMRYAGLPWRPRVVRAEGGSIGLRQALIRSVAGLVEANLALGIIGALPAALATLLTPRRQRLGDLFAGTVVVEATLLAEVDFADEAVTLRFVDGRTVRLASIDDTRVGMWFGAPVYLELRGRGADGEPVCEVLRFFEGPTAFNTEPRMREFQKRLEARRGKAATAAPPRLDWRSALIVAPLILLSALGQATAITLVLYATATRCW